jgi:hypothetical protein
MDPTSAVCIGYSEIHGKLIQTENLLDSNIRLQVEVEIQFFVLGIYLHLLIVVYCLLCNHSIFPAAANSLDTLDKRALDTVCEVHGRRSPFQLITFLIKSRRTC